MKIQEYKEVGMNGAVISAKKVDNQIYLEVDYKPCALDDGQVEDLIQWLMKAARK